jgi:hypothetical protein
MGIIRARSEKEKCLSHFTCQFTFAVMSDQMRKQFRRLTKKKKLFHFLLFSIGKMEEM